MPDHLVIAAMMQTVQFLRSNEDLFLLQEEGSVYAVYVSQETGQYLYEPIGCTTSTECECDGE